VGWVYNTHSVKKSGHIKRDEPLREVWLSTRIHGILTVFHSNVNPIVGNVVTNQGESFFSLGMMHPDWLNIMGWKWKIGLKETVRVAKMGDMFSNLDLKMGFVSI
tara:strand:+ start:904 stop:1218 length:315 start_codon:yes stop_codon:yes gene_type:complete